KCRLHHRMKTFDCGWRTQQFVDGSIVWTSPTGRSYRSTPDGAELFDDIAKALPAPRRPGSYRDHATRIAAARAAMAAKRAANTETRRINRARADEIEGRRWRNEMRFKLFLFKGTPSTSPFCRWVNDPDENETITADWRPPPREPTTDCDEPPF
ncbi:MAG: HNH endonuclease, partial [Mycobacterium sp.]